MKNLAQKLPAPDIRAEIVHPSHQAILSTPAVDFVSTLVREFRPRIQALLEARKTRQLELDRGVHPDFLEATRAIREDDWRIAEVPAELADRRVEITGPVDRKMIINALNSGARVFMADFEDSTSPTWDNLIDGQANLYDAVRGTIEYEHPTKGTYRLNDETAVLFVRPRGLHLPERHLWVDGQEAPGALVDFGLYFFHNARALLEKGSAPYFYLPKLESHLEARLWNDVFVYAQRALGIPVGTIKATVLIETITAAFEMDEILYELREHSAGLNCGRWDYIFSFIKKFKADPTRVLPDRAQITMTQPFMRAYTQLAIKTCHKRGAHAMGGMAAQIPIKNDPVKNAAALDAVRRDKIREATDGHDGTWVAHPGLVSVAQEAFDEVMPQANQIARLRDDVEVAAFDLLEMPKGTRTEAGLRQNVSVGIQYLESWLRGNGCVPLYNLMEDAATAEISRTQVWQWLRYQADVEGQPLTVERLRRVIAEETKNLTGGRFEEATDLFERLCTAEELDEFLTLPAYEYLERLQESEEE